MDSLFSHHIWPHVASSWQEYAIPLSINHRHELLIRCLLRSVFEAGCSLLEEEEREEALSRFPLIGLSTAAAPWKGSDDEVRSSIPDEWIKIQMSEGGYGSIHKLNKIVELGIG